MVIYLGLTNEKTVLILVDSSVAHRLVVHVRMRLADQGLGAVVAVCDALKEGLNVEQPDDPLGVVNIGICKKPQLNFAPVNVGKQFFELGPRLDDAVEREGVVDFGIVVQRVDLVVSHEALDGQAVVLIVLPVQAHCVFPGEREVRGKVAVDEVCHQVMHSGACRVSATRPFCFPGTM